MNADPPQSFTTFDVENKDVASVLKIREKRIYLQTSEKFKDEVESFLEGGVDRLIVDLSDVRVMNSAALGTLIGIQNAFEENGGSLYVVGLQPLMKEIFDRMRLELLFNLEPTVDAALQRVQRA